MAEVFGPAASRAERPADGAADTPTPQPVSGRSQLLVAGWQQLVLEVITETHRDARTLKKLTRNVVWLFGFLALCGVTWWCEVTAELTLRWCWAGVRGSDGTWRDASVSTARNRQWVAQTVFAIAAELGAQIDPHTAAGPKIEREPPAARAGPVIDSEFRRIRGNADPGGGRRDARWRSRCSRREPQRSKPATSAAKTSISRPGRSSSRDPRRGCAR